MITLQRLQALILFIGCVCLMTSDSRADRYLPRVGEVHPDIILPGLVDREPVSLSQFRGRKVLLVHMASW